MWQSGVVGGVGAWQSVDVGGVVGVAVPLGKGVGLVARYSVPSMYSS